MDFSKVKSMTIPEGEVALLYIDGKTVWRKAVEQLPTPTISLDGDILTMTATDDRTEEFVIFVDGVEMATVENEKEIPDNPSPPNDTVEDPLYNTAWIFKDKFSSVESPSNYSQLQDIEIDCLFSSNNISYLYIGGDVFYSTIDYEMIMHRDYSPVGGSRVRYLKYKTTMLTNVDVYTQPKRPSASDAPSGYWDNQSYRTIVVKSKITDENGELLHNILKANATQIEYNPAEIEFTIDGATYKGKENMLWEEWANSEYNTIGLTAYYQVMLGYKLLYRTGDNHQEQYNFAIIPNASYETRTPTGGGNN